MARKELHSHNTACHTALVKDMTASFLTHVYSL